jgi:hypothetical protein
MHGHVTLDLEYTPWPTATPALRASVADAFAQAGLPHSRETTAPGGDSPLPPDLAWAPTSLSVCIAVPCHRECGTAPSSDEVWMVGCGCCSPARADSVSTAAAHYTGNASGSKASAKATPLLMAWAVMLAST